MAAIKLNYPDMLQQIKLSIFTGDHSAIYSMACAVACIAASFSLITWYNKMLNDPYGRLDMRAIIRTLIVLFLTCNFYSFVLVPFDGVTLLVTKAVSASVDNDPSGLWGKVNEVYSSIEERNKKESLTGQFEEEMQRNTSNTTVEALSYETSAVAESLAEAAIQEGKRPGFFKRVWAGVKGFVSGKIGTVLDMAGNIISALLSIIVKLVQYVLLAVSSIYLIILGLIGPFVFALSLMPGFQNNISVWVARYIQISFWCPMASLIDFVNFKLKDAMLAAFWTASNTAQLAFPLHLIVMDVVTLICLLAVPQMASWIISGSGASDVNRGIATTAQKGAMLLGKIK
ncbi:MAG: hypothetical protein IJK44_06425 [Bacteroidales bacterium]|nr:hypothetical protein [Bacteroidales bacterium]